MQTAQLSGFLASLGRLSAEAAILVVLVAGAQWAFRKHLSPRWRCALWLLLAARLLMPFSFSSITSVFNLVPNWPRSHTSTPIPEIASASAPASPVVITPLPLRNSLALPTPSSLPTQTPQPHSPPWPVWIFAAWLAGVALLAGQVLVSSVRLWRRSAKLQPLTDSAAVAALDNCCRQLKVRTRPVLLEGFEIKSPALHGLIRPRLLLPKGFIDQFSLAELRFVFLHELAHLKRRDLLTNWLMAALQIIHWFNPLVWFGFSRWRADREIACDAMALEAAGEEQNELYGRTILRLLQNFSRPVSTPGLVGILEDKRQLRRRIQMIANYAPAGKWPVLASLLATGLAAIGLTDARSQSSDRHVAIGEITAVGGGKPQFDVIDAQVIDGATPINEKSTVATPSSDFASQLIGSWVLVGTPDKVRPVPTEGGRIKFYTGKYWCITQCDPKNGVVVFHHGGTYTLNGNDYSETIQYANPSTMGLIGKTNGHFNIKIERDTLTLVGFNEVWKRRTGDAGSRSKLAQDMTGAWVLVSESGQAVESPTSGAGAGYKFITPTDWCDTQAYEKNGIVVIHHGGACAFSGNEYVESVKYANPPSMQLIGQDNKFTTKVEGDTLTITGIGNPWNEVWKRAK